jgi:hypothetical protein
MQEMYVILIKAGWIWFGIVATLFLIHQIVQRVRDRKRRALRVRRGFPVKQNGAPDTTALTQDHPKQ